MRRAPCARRVASPPLPIVLPGHDVGSVKLPLVPFTWEQLATLLSPWGLVLGSETTAMHDWHHEKFTKNYALSFKYLDYLFGTYHPGRCARRRPTIVPPLHTTLIIF